MKKVSTFGCGQHVPIQKSFQAHRAHHFKLTNPLNNKMCASFDLDALLLTNDSERVVKSELHLQMKSFCAIVFNAIDSATVNPVPSSNVCVILMYLSMLHSRVYVYVYVASNNTYSNIQSVYKR